MTKSLKIIRWFYLISFIIVACSKSGGSNPEPPPVPASFSFSNLKVNGRYNGYTYYNVPLQTVLKFSFSTNVDHNSVSNSISFVSSNGTSVSFATSYENSDSTIVIAPSSFAYI